MSEHSPEWRPEWKIDVDRCIDTDEALTRLDYVVEWRTWLWRKPAEWLLVPFERFRGQRVLEFGHYNGRLSCLLAAAGAQVTGLDLDRIPTKRAIEEAKRWGVESRVEFITYDGNYDRLPRQQYDFIVSKSALVMTDKSRLDQLFAALNERLTVGGRLLCLENSANRTLRFIRKHLLHRHISAEYWEYVSWGFTRADLARMAEHFGPMKVRRHLCLVWAIEAQRRSSGSSGG